MSFGEMLKSFWNFSGLGANFFDVARAGHGFDFQKCSQAANPVEVNLDVAHEIDLAPFVHHGQNSQRPRENGPHGVPARQEHHLHQGAPGVGGVGALVKDQGIFHAPFPDLQAPRGNVEVGVNLMVRSQEARAQLFEGGAHRSRVLKASLEFEIEKFHECKAPAFTEAGKTS